MRMRVHSWMRITATGDDGHFIGFVDVIPTQRAKPGDTEVYVSAPDAAGVRVLQAWYEPGEERGCEIVYPKGDIQKLDPIAELRLHGSGHSAGKHSGSDQLLHPVYMIQREERRGGVDPWVSWTRRRQSMRSMSISSDSPAFSNQIICSILNPACSPAIPSL